MGRKEKMAARDMNWVSCNNNNNDAGCLTHPPKGEENIDDTVDDNDEKKDHDKLTTLTTIPTTEMSTDDYHDYENNEDNNKHDHNQGFGAVRPAQAPADMN